MSYDWHLRYLCIRFNCRSSFSILELVLAIAIFSIISLTAITTMYSNIMLNQSSEKLEKATNYAEEAIEAINSMRRDEWCNSFINGTYGLAVENGRYVLSGTGNDYGDFHREITISDVYRDANYNITDDTNGIIDPFVKKFTITVDYNKVKNPSERRVVELVTYIANWGSLTTDESKGILVYSDEESSKEVLKYRNYSATGPCGAGYWYNSQLAYDYPSLSNDYVIRRVEIYETDVRKEMVAVTRSINSSHQNAIYAVVWDGENWGNAIELSNFLDIATYANARNYDGAYTNDGTFYVFYSKGDNNIYYRIWDGSSWSSENQAFTVGGIPEWIFSKPNPLANSIMIGVRDMAKNTTTAYYDGGSFSSAVVHATDAKGTAYQNLSIDWVSSNGNATLTMIYDNGTANQMSMKFFTASNNSWSFGLDIPTLFINPKMYRVENDPTNNNKYILCTQVDVWPSPYMSIWCADMTRVIGNFNSAVVVTTRAASNLDQTYDVKYEANSGENAIVVYPNGSDSDERKIPKFRVYNSQGGSWSDEQELQGSMPGEVKSVILDDDPKTNDIMAIVGDDQRNIATNVWFGYEDHFSTIGQSAFTVFSTSGSNDVYYWFDFKWEN